MTTIYLFGSVPNHRNVFIKEEQETQFPKCGRYQPNIANQLSLLYFDINSNFSKKCNYLL